MFTSVPEYTHALRSTRLKKKLLSSIRNTAVIVWCTLDIQEENVEPLTRLFYPIMIEALILSSGSLPADGPRCFPAFLYDDLRTTSVGSDTSLRPGLLLSMRD